MSGNEGGEVSGGWERELVVVEGRARPSVGAVERVVHGGVVCSSRRREMEEEEKERSGERKKEKRKKEEKEIEVCQA